MGYFWSLHHHCYHHHHHHHHCYHHHHQLEFLDPYPSSMWLGLVHGDQQAANKLKELAASLMLVVYAVDDQPSLTHGSRLLNCLKRMGMLENRPAMLVANKADL